MYAVNDILAVWYPKENASDHQAFLERLDKTVRPILDNSLDVDYLESSPEGRLALILIYDQAPRFLYDDSRYLHWSDKAREYTVRFCLDGSYLDLEPKHQALVFLPFHHSENMEDQLNALGAYTRISGLDPKLKQWLPMSENYNRIISRFGRFPHRNLVLGRENTYDEFLYFIEEGDLSDLTMLINDFPEDLTKRAEEKMKELAKENSASL